MNHKGPHPPFGFNPPGPAEDELEWSGPAAPGSAEPDPVLRAEQAVASLQQELKGLVEAEVKILTQHFARARAQNLPRKAVSDFLSQAHDLKGQAATLGYPLVSEVCASLCKLLGSPVLAAGAAAALIEAHLAALSDFAAAEPGRAIAADDRKRIDGLRRAVNLSLSEV